MANRMLNTCSTPVATQPQPDRRQETGDIKKNPPTTPDTNNDHPNNYRNPNPQPLTRDHQTAKGDNQQ